jgi:hypothetical protein
MTPNETVVFMRAKLGWLMGDLDYLAEQFSRRTQASTLVDDMRSRIVEILVRISNPKICNAPHQEMFFCVLEKGHKGKHKEGDKAWTNASSKNADKSTNIKVNATSRYSKTKKSKTKKSKTKKSKKAKQ